LVSRGDTTVVDAYLSPILRRYVDRISTELNPKSKIQNLKSKIRLLFLRPNGISS
ncbi:MAG: hypothetical protein F6K09_35035, partial [Merismopedia sp. SIO2A8]|nr:hypothetical protein [Merismopedia sp. SIO2A8]